MPILVFDLNDPHAILRAVNGEKVGTSCAVEPDPRLPPFLFTMSHPILNEAQTKMKKTVDHTLHEFSTIHTGKASPTMLEGVMVEAYGSQVRLKECAAITTPDAHMIVVQPWDRSIVKAIEKAIQIANLGFNPSIDATSFGCRSRR